MIRGNYELRIAPPSPPVHGGFGGAGMGIFEGKSESEGV
jgi:hypothetical protein